MIKLKDVIRSEKSNVDTGKWANGHIPRAAFPMSKLKDKRYKFGPVFIVVFAMLAYVK